MTTGNNDAMMHSNCCVTVDCSTCHEWRGKRTKENEQMGVGQDLVCFCFDGGKWYGGEEDEVI